eukprot:38698-Chlamydomonas_euryale.AAC.5
MGACNLASKRVSRLPASCLKPPTPSVQLDGDAERRNQAPMPSCTTTTAAAAGVGFGGSGGAEAQRRQAASEEVAMRLSEAISLRVMRRTLSPSTPSPALFNPQCRPSQLWALQCAFT